MTSLLDVRNVSVSIHGPPDVVYEFARDGNNLPRWASGLGQSVRLEQGAWIAEGPLGRVSVRFADRNALGVLDHDVTLPSGQVVHNPMRVVPNAGGSTVTFTLMRLPGVSEEKFDEDARFFATARVLRIQAPLRMGSLEGWLVRRARARGARALGDSRPAERLRRACLTSRGRGDSAWT